MSRDTVPIVKGQSKDQLRVKAERLLSRYCPDCLINPQPVPVDYLVQFKLPKDFDVDFSVAPLPHPAEAVMIPMTATKPTELIMAPEVFEGLISGDPRSRFTGGHEILHAIDHSAQIQTQLVDTKYTMGLYRKSEIPAYLNPEWQANRFAAELLMPAEMVKLAFQRSNGRLKDVADIFQVSRTAMLIRFEQLWLL